MPPPYVLLLLPPPPIENFRCSIARPSSYQLLVERGAGGRSRRRCFFARSPPRLKKRKKVSAAVDRGEASACELLGVESADGRTCVPVSWRVFCRNFWAFFRTAGPRIFESISRDLWFGVVESRYLTGDRPLWWIHRSRSSSTSSSVPTRAR